MILTQLNLLELADVAKKATLKAGGYIASRSDETVVAQTKEGGSTLASQVFTEVDIQSEKIILEVLSPTCKKYDLGMLAEESPDASSRLVKDYFWCVDPLDGTLPFIEGVAGYAISIALVSHSGEPVVGVVYDPLKGDLYSAVKGDGVMVNDIPFSQSKAEGQRLTFITDRSFIKHKQIYQIKTALEQYCKSKGYSGIDIISNGGAAMNACWVLQKSPACYFKFPKKEDGGGSLWDYAATACILEEANFFVSNIFGESLDLNRNDSTFMNHEGILYATELDLRSFILDLYKRLKDV
jgi:myo-inositol-1(or 4)-monophosphatase